MLHTITKPETPQLAVTGDKVLINVPWHLAGALQHYLHRHGIGGTLHLDPVAGEARLELWDGISENHVRKLLTHWKG